MRSDTRAHGTVALFLGWLILCCPAASRASDCDPLPECSASECGFPLNPAPPGNACGAGGYTAKVTRTFSQEAGGQRTFFVYRPPVAGALPAVIVYHGGDDHCTAACRMLQDTHMKAVADEQGFLVIFPLGQHPLPDPPHPPGSIDCHGWGWKYADYVDYATANDVQFTRELIAYALDHYCIDATRIYATGFSQGGFLSYRLACQLSDWIAAVAPVAAADVISFDPRQTAFPLGCNPPQAPALYDDCHPFRPVPVLHSHGDADAAVGYHGGGLCSTWPGAVNSTWRWINDHNGCFPSGSVVYDCGGAPGCQASCTAYSDACLEGAEVQLCTILGGNHAWPGGRDDPIGDLDASEYAAEFLQRFERAQSLVNVGWPTTNRGVSAVLNRLSKSGAIPGWNGGAWSAQTLQPGNGTLQLVAGETDTTRAIGLDHGDPPGDLTPLSLDFGFQLDVNASLKIVDGGVLYSGGSYTPGDLLKIEIVAGGVRFWSNQQLLRTSSVAPQYPLKVRGLLYTPKATLGGVVLSGNVTP